MTVRVPRRLADIDLAAASGIVARELRIEAGLTVKAVATGLRIAPPNYGRFEKGGHTPTLENLHRIAEFYRLDLADMMERIVAVAYERAGKPRRRGERP